MRSAELRGVTDGEKIRSRGYVPADLAMVTSMGTAGSFIAALVFMLYVEGGTVQVIYREPSFSGSSFLSCCIGSAAFGSSQVVGRCATIP